MSRIDEALARAGRAMPADLPSVPTAPVGTIEPVFAPDDRAREPELGRASRQVEAAAVADLHDETLGAPTASGSVRALPQSEKLIGAATTGPYVEQHRRLAGRLLMAQAERGTRVVMITSALPGEGKTLTAANLALTLSESYKRSVLLVDADLRRPSIHQVLQIGNASGLNDGLRDAGRRLPLIRLTEHLSVLTAGRPEADPMSVLSGDRMTRVIHEAAQRFDWVIVDTPPVALLTDAHLLSGLVDAAVLVIQTGRTPLAAIKTAVQAVGRERILGVVMNRADDAVHAAAYEYYGNYEVRTER